jgi:hypothetical protein
MRLTALLILFGGLLMADRQYMIPGVGYVSETGTRQYAISGAYVNETVTGGAPPATIRKRVVVTIAKNLRRTK